MPAIPAHSSATTDAPWDGPAQEAKLKSPITGTEARNMYAWRDPNGQDPDGDGWPDFKAGYRFPHHMVGENGVGGAANVKACSGGIAALNGARGGTTIPSDDKQGVYDHLARHMRAAGMEPPPFGASVQESDEWATAVERIALVGDDAKPRGSADELQLPILPPLGHTLWALREEDMPRLLDAYRQHVSDLSMSDFSYESGGIEVAGNGVAVIPLSGLITPRPSILSLLFGGGGGLEGFRCAFRDAVNSAEVKKIVLDIDSPGGLVSLVPETAAEMQAARGSKPIVAVVNTLCASAAYWLAAQADEIVCTPSGQAGSIGVFKVHVDHSGRNEMMGVNPAYIKAGRFKTEGNADEPLSSDARQHFQQEVDDLYAMFVEGVAGGRKTSSQAVSEGYGQGRCLLAQRALNAGLVDRIGTIAEVVGAAVEDDRPAEDVDEDDVEPDDEARLERRRRLARMRLNQDFAPSGA